MKKKIVVPLCVFVLAIIIGAVWYCSHYNQYRNYQQTIGVVTDYKVTYGAISKVGSSRYYHFYYSYSVSGKAYSGYEKFTGSSGKTGVGSEIPVWYNPDNPSESTLNTNGSLNFIVPIFLAVPLMLGTYTVFSRQEKKSRLL